MYEEMKIDSSLYMQCRKKENLRTMARPQSVVGIVSNLKLLTT